MRYYVKFWLADGTFSVAWTYSEQTAALWIEDARGDGIKAEYWDEGK